MSAKEDLLRPRVIDCLERLRKLIEVNAPAVIIGAEAWNVLATVLACYGPAAGARMVDSIRESNLRSRRVCSNGECANYVEIPDVGICQSCRVALEVALGIDDASLGEEVDDL